MKNAFTFKNTAFATLALVCVGASAQSSVTLYGVVDSTFMVGKGSLTNKTQLGNSGNTTTRLGFRGTEDLGGGLKAGFVLEAGFDNNTGAGGATNPNNQGVYNPATGKFSANSTGGGGLTFNRRSMLTLAGAWGELRLGRDYTPHYWQYAVFDPFTMNGVGASVIYAGSLGGPTLVRASNSIGYVLPKGLGGFYGQAQIYSGNNAANNDGDGVSARLGYEFGPLNVALAAGRTKVATPGDITTINAGLSYDLGAVKLSGMYGTDEVGNVAKSTGYMVGASMPLGAGQLRANYSQTKLEIAGTTPKASKFSVGYVHNLSKRTALYGTVSFLDNKNGAKYALNGATTAANASSKGLDFGIRHAF